MEAEDISTPLPNLPEKVERYERFINDVLKEQLKKTEQDLDKINCELAEYVQLKCFLESAIKMDLHKTGIKTQMDIGCNFYMEAKVEDPSTLLLSVGLGHYVEYTIEEALKVIDKRVNLLEKQCAILRKSSASTKAHIKLVLLGLQELQSLK